MSSHGVTHEDKRATMHLPNRALGTTGLRITRVGFGAWAIGGSGWHFAWGRRDDAESIAAIRHAVESGVNWIDTAAVYGLGHSEEVFARALREIPANERPELPWCAAHDTGVIVYSPMQSGLLSGAFTADRAVRLPADDWRSRADEFRGINLHRDLALADALRPIAHRYDATVGAIAIAWTLAWPGVTGAIVGARNAAQVDGWMRAATLELTQDDLRGGLVRDPAHARGAGRVASKPELRLTPA